MKFSRRARLSGAAAFGAVFKRPRVSRDAYFRVLSRANGLPHSRLGMAVSRRVCSRAVGRNRLKRLVRESFRAWMASGAATRDFVVLPSVEAATISSNELLHSLQEHWRAHARPEDEATR